MAKIMRIEVPEKTIDIEKPVLVDPNKAMTGGRIVESVGKGMSDLADGLMRAQDLTETTKAKNELNFKIQDIKKRQAMDQDYSPANRQKYYDELETAYSESGNGVSIPRSKGDVMRDSFSQAGIAKMELEMDFNQKMVKDMAVQQKTYEATLSNEYSSTKNPLVKQNAIVKLDKMYSKNIAYGAMTPAQAEHDRIAFLTKATTDEMITDAYADPQGVLNELGKEDGGIYSKVTAKNKAIIKVRAEKNLKEAKEAVTVRELNNASAIAAEILDAKGNPQKEAEVYKRMEQFSLSSTHAEAVEAAFLAMMNEDPKKLSDYWEVGADKKISIATRETINLMHKLNGADIEKINKLQGAYIKEFGSGKGNKDPINLYWVLRSAAEAANRNPNVEKVTNQFDWMAQVAPRLLPLAMDIFMRTYDWKSDPSPAAKESVKKAYSAISGNAGKYKIGSSRNVGGVTYDAIAENESGQLIWDARKNK